MAEKNRRQRRLEQSRRSRAQRTQDAQRGRAGSGHGWEPRRPRAAWAGVLVSVAGGVWAGGSNPGRVVAVAHG
ncbi:MAG TPA: hypothetical protein VHY81_05380 [Acidimicrobiales bacterium]|nr:hypothetical protein [Acidimicrobiales bacterium]